VPDGGGHVGHGEGEVAQAGGFGVAGAGRRVGEEKQLQHVLPADGQIQFVRVARRPVGFGHDFEPENFGVEAFRGHVIGTDNGSMGKVGLMGPAISAIAAGCGA
jgi:hypothetical protein